MVLGGQSMFLITITEAKTAFRLGWENLPYANAVRVERKYPT